MKRQFCARILAVLLVLAVPLRTFAATHEVSDFSGMETAFQDTDTQVTVNLANDVNWEHQLTAGEGQTYTINGNGNALNNVYLNGKGTVNINADINGIQDGNKSNGNALTATNTTVNVTGDITADGRAISAYNADISVQGDVKGGRGGIRIDNGELTVNGNIDAGWEGVVANNSTVQITGDISSGMTALHAFDYSSAVVEGNITSDANAVEAIYFCDVTVTGNIESKEDGVTGYISDVTVNGDIQSGKTAVDVEYSAVTVNGDVSGAGQGITGRGSGVTVNGDIKGTGGGVQIYTGTVTVNGNIETPWGAISAEEKGHVEVNGDITSEHGGVFVRNASATIHGDLESTYANGVNAGDESFVTVYGTVDAGYDGVLASNGSHVYVEQINAGMDGAYARNQSTVTVQNGIEAGNNGVISYDSTVKVVGGIDADRNGVAAYGSAVEVTGDVRGGGSEYRPEIQDEIPPDLPEMSAHSGVAAYSGSQVTVKGNVYGGNASKNNGIGGAGITAQNAQVTVQGSVYGGNVPGKPGADSANIAGAGIDMNGSATVKVSGNVTGGSGSHNAVTGGNGLNVAVNSGENAGSVTIGGTVSGGKGGSNGGTDGYSIFVTDSNGSYDAVLHPTYSIKKVNGGRSGVHSNLEGDEHEALTDSILGGSQAAGSEGGSGASGGNTGGDTAGGVDTENTDQLPATAAAGTSFIRVHSDRTVSVPAVVSGDKAVIWAISSYLLNILMMEHTGAVSFDCSEFDAVTSLRIPAYVLKKLLEKADAIQVHFAKGSVTLTAQQILKQIENGAALTVSAG